MSCTLFLAFLILARVSSLVPPPAVIFPATGIAIGILALEGLAFWPIVYFASLTNGLIAGASPISLLVMPLAHALFAVAGAYILRSQNIDPLFRSWRDVFILFIAALASSLIIPTAGTFAHFASDALGFPARISIGWGPWYVATIFTVFVVTPFVMRWWVKPRFARRWLELLETAAAFLLLGTIEYFLFFTNIPTIAGISFVYFMLIPLFWIALRLRPRFITLALIVTSVFAVASLLVGPHVPAPELFGDRLYQTELFLIIVGLLFLSFSSLEESRRVTSNLLRLQVANLENAVSRISVESRAKNDFIAVLAHELRNPLAPVVASIEYLKAKGGFDAEDTEALTIMDDRMHVVKRLLDDLLDVSRISEGKLSLQREVVDVEQVVRKAALSTDHSFKERHQQLFIQAPSDTLLVDGDSTRIEQIVSNLLTNASRYSNAGDRITISIGEKGNDVELRVQDNGIGIAPDTLAYIFEPFRQAETGSKANKGLGIGLALVRSLVEMHGGSVRAESAGKDAGSTFVVRLPRSKQNRASKEILPQKPNVLHPREKQGSGPRVLVVDDNDAASWGIGKLLELRGASVSYAYDGDQAVESVQNNRPDTILLDIGLPGRDGFDVAHDLRALGFDGKLIALTGYSLEETRTRAEAAGFDEYLVKPIGLAELTRVVPGL
ncbi:MAG: Chemotaxis protein methyltransferase CheR [Parcubacteria bacterium C7867-001]|nr:MAG: Chemotaxis protein methyltransferase CheR [Parcubacteria bacterium C7867-001]